MPTLISFKLFESNNSLYYYYYYPIIWPITIVIIVIIIISGSSCSIRTFLQYFQKAGSSSSSRPSGVNIDNTE